MKACILLLMLATTAVALDREQVDRLLAQAMELQGDEYLTVRHQFEKASVESLPLLREAAVDPRLTWQQRLVARIAVERILRADEIRALQSHNWSSYPPFVRVRDNPRLLGPSRYGVAGQMRQYVVPKMKEAELWYYYIEQNWKTMWPLTTETGRGGQGFAEYWPRWCREALEGQPEEMYLWMAIADRIEKDEHFLKFYEERRLFWQVIRKKIGRTVPALVAGWERFLAFEHEDYPGAQPGILELNRKRRSEAHPGFLRAILDFAEPEHVDILERFIEQHESELGKYRSELEAVRKRTRQRVEEPPFRCEKKPPLEGMVKPPPGFFDPPKPPEPPPADTSPKDIVIEVN